MGILNLFGLLGAQSEGSVRDRIKLETYAFDQITRRDIGLAHCMHPKANEDYGHLLLVVVAGGAYRSQTVIVQARIARNRLGGDLHNLDVVAIEAMGRPAPTEIAERLAQMARGLPGVQVLINAGGLGVSVARLLNNEGVPHLRFNPGENCATEALRDRYVNRKAQSYDRMCQAFAACVITFQCEPPVYLYGDAHRIGRRVIDGRIEFAPAKEIGFCEGVDVLDAMSLAYLDGIAWKVVPTKPLLHQVADDARAAAADVETSTDQTAQQQAYLLATQVGQHNPLYTAPPGGVMHSYLSNDVPAQRAPEPAPCEPTRHSSHSASDYGSSHSSHSSSDSYSSSSCSSSSYDSDSSSSSSSSSSWD